MFCKINTIIVVTKKFILLKLTTLSNKIIRKIIDDRENSIWREMNINITQCVLS